MLTPADRRKQYKVMERLREQRIKNLRLLRNRFGTWAALARRLGVGDAFLNNLAGPNHSREIGEKVVRGFETTLALPEGWFDRPHAASEPTPYGERTEPQA